MQALEYFRKLGSRTYFVLLILLVIQTAPVSGQSTQETKGVSLRPDVAFADHLKRQFHVREGLPSGYVQDAIQTRDGYVWIATPNGIARYDGFQFEVFNRANTPQLPSNDSDDPHRSPCCYASSEKRASPSLPEKVRS